MLGFVLIKTKITSYAKMKKYAEIGSPCLVLLSSLKHGVVVPSLIAHHSRFLINIFINFINSLRNPNFFGTRNKKNGL